MTPRIFEVKRYPRGLLRKWCVVWISMDLCRPTFTMKGAYKLRDKLQADFDRETGRRRR